MNNSAVNYIKRYPLEGGAEVTVHQPFGTQVYSAYVTMPENGQYPGVGKVAKDIGRSEFIFITEGHFSISINQQITKLSKGESILINDGDTYALNGTGSCLVLVKDNPAGRTEIINIK